MKRILLLFLLTLSIPMLSFSQNISTIKTQKDSSVVISKETLKKINHIFLEKSKIEKENLVYKEIVNDLTKINKNLISIDSIRSFKINKLNQTIDTLSIENKTLKEEVVKKTKKIKNRNKIIGGLSISTLSLIGFLILI